MGALIQISQHCFKKKLFSSIKLKEKNYFLNLIYGYTRQYYSLELNNVAHSVIYVLPISRKDMKVKHYNNEKEHEPMNREEH